jgi:hypothetical protein
MNTEKPQITQINAGKENPSATICANLRYLRFDRINRETKSIWKGVSNG